MSIIWIPQDNRYVTDAIIKIEALKHDLSKCNVEITRAIAKVGEFEVKVKLIQTTVTFLKDDAKVVNAYEYKLLIYRLAGAKESLVFMQKQLEYYLHRKDVAQMQLKLLEDELPFLRFKLLELKRDHQKK